MTDTTLKVWSSTEVFSITQTLLACGTELNAESTVIVAPDTLLIVLVSKEPSDKITDKVAEPVVAKSVLFWSSTIIWVVDTPVLIRPPLLTPALIGSAIFITVPTLTIVPLSKDAVNVTVSASLFCVYKNQRPSLAAWPLDVVAKPFKFFVTIPYLACNAVSSTVS